MKIEKYYHNDYYHAFETIKKLEGTRKGLTAEEVAKSSLEHHMYEISREGGRFLLKKHNGKLIKPHTKFTPMKRELKYFFNRLISKLI